MKVRAKAEKVEMEGRERTRDQKTSQDLTRPQAQGSISQAIRCSMISSSKGLRTIYLGNGLTKTWYIYSMEYYVATRKDMGAFLVLIWKDQDQKLKTKNRMVYSMLPCV